MMLYKLIPPSVVTATIQLPASKSISNRALIINALGKGIYPPENLSDCDDTQVMIKALTEGKETIDIMAAGTAMRFLTAYLSVTPGERTITGTARMQQRPIQILVNALRELGAEIEYVHHEGYPPLCIKGAELKGNEITLKGNVSSQYISALLMIGPALKDGLTLHLSGEIISRPYINLTLQLMQDFGAKAAWTSPSSISVAPQPYQSIPFKIESDWSAASYWYQIAALSPKAEIELLGLFRNSYQGDSRGAEVFSRLGITTEFTSQGVKLKKTGKAPERLEEDFVDIPDLAQTFVVTCALLNIPFRFTGLQSLKIKETDRIAALRAELKKLGYVTDGFVDSVIKREMAVSTEVGFGFAIPHGSPKDVRHSGIAVVRLDKAVLWHSGEEVDTIFLIAACTDKRPQDMDELKGFYKLLAVLLDEEEPRKRFKSLNKAQDICNYINGKHTVGQS